MNFKIAVCAAFLLFTGMNSTLAQRQNASKVAYLVGIIDSLDHVIAEQKATISGLESSLKKEQNTVADLQSQLTALEDKSKKLETNVNTFQGENLKLSQSNRILIVFNSFVAVLLIVTLVFYLRKMNRKPVIVQNQSPKQNGSGVSSVHASFEDKLQQLERLGKLREKGFLSDDEFLAEKNRVLGK